MGRYMQLLDKMKAHIKQEDKESHEEDDEERNEDSTANLKIMAKLQQLMVCPSSCYHVLIACPDSISWAACRLACTCTKSRTEACNLEA